MNTQKFYFSFLLALFLLPAITSAQDCRCCEKRAEGQALFNKKQYEQAIGKWETAKGLIGAAEKCPDLAGLISKARQRIKTRDADAARQKAADDLWNIIRLATNPEPFEQFLKQYPESRHAADARRLRDQYKPKPAEPVKTDPPVTKKEETTPAVASFLVKIPGGTFAMGDQFGEGDSNELRVHNVTLSDFYLSRYEVSFDEFDAFCSATGREKPFDSDWGRGKRPAINVDWYDAIEYCNWLSGQHNLRSVYAIDKTTQDPNNTNTGDSKKWTVRPDWNANGYRLPTEAEWEYAARGVRSTSGAAQGGGKVRFGNGRDIIDPSEINFDASMDFKKPYSIVGEYRQKTIAVDELSANVFGLKNMSGNVWEWCWDWYDSDFYKNSEDARDPKGGRSGSARVFRGGSWNYYPENCRASNRVSIRPNFRYYYLGFRVARHL